MSMELVFLVGFIALVIGLSVGFFLKGKKVPSAVEPSPDLSTSSITSTSLCISKLL